MGVNFSSAAAPQRVAGNACAESLPLLLVPSLCLEERGRWGFNYQHYGLTLSTKCMFLVCPRSEDSGCYELSRWEGQ